MTKTMTKTFKSLFATACLCATLVAAGPFASGALAHGVKVGDLEIGHPYARAMVPGAKVGGGYLTVTNTGTSDDRLIAASAEAAASVQIHEMKMDNNIMEMKELKDGIAIPAGGKLELTPGSYHLMFMNVAKPFKEGEKFKGTLTFEKAGTVNVEFVVGPLSGGKGGDADAAGHDHMQMDMKK